jgi:hypothetical protein
MTDDSDPKDFGGLDEAQAAALLDEVDPVQRESGLVLDRYGRWHHQGVPVSHERLHRALTRWLTRRPGEARHNIQVSPEFWAWVDVEDAPYVAHLRELLSDGLRLELSDGREVVWRGERIAVGEDDAWYIRLAPRPGEASLEARLSRGAMGSLAEHLEETGTTREAGAETREPAPRNGDPPQDPGSVPGDVSLRLPSGRRVGFTPREAEDQSA